MNEEEKDKTVDKPIDPDTGVVLDSEQEDVIDLNCKNYDEWEKQNNE